MVVQGRFFDGAASVLAQVLVPPALAARCPPLPRLLGLPREAAGAALGRVWGRDNTRGRGRAAETIAGLPVVDVSWTVAVAAQANAETTAGGAFVPAASVGAGRAGGGDGAEVVLAVKEEAGGGHTGGKGVACTLRVRLPRRCLGFGLEQMCMVPSIIEVISIIS